MQIHYRQRIRLSTLFLINSLLSCICWDGDCWDGDDRDELRRRRRLDEMVFQVDEEKPWRRWVSMRRVRFVEEASREHHVMKVNVVAFEQSASAPSPKPTTIDQELPLAATGVCFLASSWSVANCPAEAKRRRAVDPWRKWVLAASMEQLAKDEGDFVRNLPAFEPSYLKELCTIFWKNLRGKGEISGGKASNPVGRAKENNGDNQLKTPNNYFSKPIFQPINHADFDAAPRKYHNLQILKPGLFNTPKWYTSTYGTFPILLQSQGINYPGGEIVEAAAPADMSELWVNTVEIWKDCCRVSILSSKQAKSSLGGRLADVPRRIALSACTRPYINLVIHKSSKY